MPHSELPLPDHFRPERAGELFRVEYEARAAEARRWAEGHALRPARDDAPRVALLLVDVQNTFALPGGELFVGGRSGQAAVDDTARLVAFLYRNLANVTQIVPTLDTHRTYQIFHAAWLVDQAGQPPPPYTEVSVDDVAEGRWRFAPAAAAALGISTERGQRHLEHYASQLAAAGRYRLTIWPYHAMLGSVGNALVPLVEEAVFFHSIARTSQPDFHVKGGQPLTEHYSVLGPEVTEDAEGRPIAHRDDALVERLLAFDATIVAGQAKSHCVAWTIADLLRGIEATDRELARRVYLLEDCTSPVVVPGGHDFTEAADAAFARFAAAGMHLVRSTTPMAEWGIGSP